ncbi:Gal11 protein [Hanseniaspora uvarum]|nr:Gal11 protein [Hanseniaspora uvarum]
MSTSSDAWRATVTKHERLGFVKALADILIKISNLKNNGKTDSDKLKQTAADYENNLYLSSTSKNNYFESITNRIEMTQDTYNKQQRQFMQTQQQKQIKQQPRTRPHGNSNNIVVNNLTINIPNQFQNGKFSFTEQQQTEILNELKYAPIPKELLSKIPNCPSNVTNWKEVLQAGLANNDAVKSLYKYHQSYFFKVKRDEVLQKIQMSGLLPNINASGNNTNNNTANNSNTSSNAPASNANLENSSRYITPEQQKALLETAQVLLRNLQKQGKVPANLSNDEYNLYIKRYFNEFAQKRLNQLKQQQQSAAPVNQNKPIDNQQLLQKLNEYFTSDEQKTLVGQAKAAIRASQQKGSISATLSTEEHQMLIKRYIYGVITKKEQQIQQQRQNAIPNSMSVDPKSQILNQNKDYQQASNTQAGVAKTAVSAAPQTVPPSNIQSNNLGSAKSRPSAGSSTPLPTIKSNNPLFEDFSNLKKLGKIQKNIEIIEKKRKEIYHYSQADLFMETLNDTMFGLNNKKYQHQPMINLQQHVVDFVNNTGKKKLTKALLKQRDQENIKIEVNKNTQSIVIDFKDQNILGMNNITTGNPLGLLSSQDYKTLFDGLSNDAQVMDFLIEQEKIKSINEKDSLYAQPVPLNILRKRKISYEISANEPLDLKKVKVSPSTEDIIKSNMIDVHKINGNHSTSNTLVNNSTLTDISRKTNNSDADISAEDAPQSERVKTPNPEIDDPYTLEYWESVSKYENSLAAGSADPSSANEVAF